ncbi:MAG: SgcJ/EcaC family oxidoreductase [Ardenticatenaceae bacterium]|nr:SgcJ/EcaC family oxidoreductase [Ardenticatenaceae bacterium]
MTERIKNIDVALIYRLWREVAAAVNTGDLEKWISFWTPNGIQMPPGMPRRQGREQIQEAMAQVFQQFRYRKARIDPEEVRINGQSAYSHGTYNFEKSPSGQDEFSTYSGKFLAILEKQIDGSWKIAVDCFNYDETGLF